MNRLLYKNLQVKEKINNLNLSDELKEGLINIWINDQCEAPVFEEEFDQDMIYQLEERSSNNESTTSSEECDGSNLCDCIKCQKTTNMLTKN